MKKDYSHIATPDKIPNSLDLSSYPVKPGNAAIRELSESNKDLVARLNVQLRRNGELEAHCENLKKRIEALIAQNEDLSNSSLKNRELAQLHQKDMEEAKRLLSISEIELGELSIEYRKTREILEQNKIDIAYELKRHKKYRKRIQQKVRPYINRILQENIDLMNTLRTEQSNNYLSKDQISQLQDRLNREKKLHQSKVVEAGQLQDEIIATYELELTQYKNLLDQREIELNKATSRTRYLEEIRDKYVVMENKAIAAERMRFEIEKKYDGKISELRQSLIEQKEQYKAEKKAFESQSLLLEKLQEENEELIKRVYSSGTEVASLQGRTQVEFITNQELKALKNSIEKENQELKRKMAAMQTENSLLREEIDNFKNPPRIPESVPGQDKDRLIDPITPNQAAEPIFQDSKLAHLDFDEMSEIDKLIREIECGYPSTKQKDLV